MLRARDVLALHWATLAFRRSYVRFPPGADIRCASAFDPLRTFTRGASKRLTEDAREEADQTRAPWSRSRVSDHGYQGPKLSVGGLLIFVLVVNAIFALPLIYAHFMGGGVDKAMPVEKAE